MPWNRNDPHPLEARRKLLEEQERMLAQQRRLLSEQLRTGELPGGNTKPVEPPVWRREEDDNIDERDIEPTPARKRHLARQRQRDMILFFIVLIVLLIVFGIIIWVYVHTAAPAATT